MGTVIPFRQAAHQSSLSSSIKKAFGSELPRTAYVMGYERESERRFMIPLTLNEVGDYQSDPVTLEESILVAAWDGFSRFVALL